MTDLIKPIVSNMIESFLDNEFQIVEVFDLKEAVNTFNDLPASWKKKAASIHSGGPGGKDSKVEVIAATKKIKSASNIISTMKKALRREGAALVWIEMNGEPLVAVNKDYDNSYTLLNPSGKFVTKTVRDKIRGTDKWDRKLKKYIPAQYWERQSRSLKSTEAAEKMWEVAYQTLEAMNKDLEEPRNSVFELAQEMQFEVRVMYPDESRIAKRAERKDARSGVDSDLIKNRKNTIEKAVKQKINPIVDKIKAEVDTQVSNALEGKQFDFKEVEKELRRINDVSSRLQRILKSEQVRLKTGWSDKAELDYDLKSIMDSLKELD